MSTDCRRAPIWFALLSLCAGWSGALAETAQGTCASFTHEASGHEVLASAGAVDNLLSRRNSIRDESERMLQEADRARRTVSAPEGVCPEYCALPATPQIVFRSEPTSRLESYDEAQRCEQLLVDTMQDPLTYAREFPSVEELSEWIRSLARGKGAEGEDLYRQCDGRCSPDYMWLIDDNGDGLSVDARIVCGHARDRKDNRYRISYSLRWSCQERSVPGSTKVRTAAAAP